MGVDLLSVGHLYEVLCDLVWGLCHSVVSFWLEYVFVVFLNRVSVLTLLFPVVEFYCE